MSQTVRVPYADTKEEFIETIKDGEWVITEDNVLMPRVYHDKEAKVAFSVFGQAPHHTTDWLRFFCNKHHPEIDFDTEFETEHAGVFSRYQDLFGNDYEDEVNEAIYKSLWEQLAEHGYRISWEVIK